MRNCLVCKRPYHRGFMVFSPDEWGGIQESLIRAAVSASRWERGERKDRERIRQAANEEIERHLKGIICPECMAAIESELAHDALEAGRIVVTGRWLAVNG